MRKCIIRNLIKWERDARREREGDGVLWVQCSFLWFAISSTTAETLNFCGEPSSSSSRNILPFSSAGNIILLFVTGEKQENSHKHRERENIADKVCRNTATQHNTSKHQSCCCIKVHSAGKKWTVSLLNETKNPKNRRTKKTQFLPTHSVAQTIATSSTSNDHHRQCQSECVLKSHTHTITMAQWSALVLLMAQKRGGWRQKKQKSLLKQCSSVVVAANN